MIKIIEILKEKVFSRSFRIIFFIIFALTSFLPILKLSPYTMESHSLLMIYPSILRRFEIFLLPWIILHLSITFIISLGIKIIISMNKIKAIVVSLSLLFLTRFIFILYAYPLYLVFPSKNGLRLYHFKRYNFSICLPARPTMRIEHSSRGTIRYYQSSDEIEGELYDIVISDRVEPVTNKSGKQAVLQHFVWTGEPSDIRLISRTYYDMSQYQAEDYDMSQYQAMEYKLRQKDENYIKRVKVFFIDDTDIVAIGLTYKISNAAFVEERYQRFLNSFERDIAFREIFRLFPRRRNIDDKVSTPPDDDAIQDQKPPREKYPQKLKRVKTKGKVSEKLQEYINKEGKKGNK